MLMDMKAHLSDVDLAELSDRLDTMNLGRVALRRQGHGATDDTTVFVKTSGPAEAVAGLCAEVVNTRAAHRIGVRAPFPLADPFLWTDSDGFPRCATVWERFDGTRLDPNTTPRRTVASLANQLRRLSRAEPWEDLHRYSTPDTVARIKGYAAGYAGNTEHLIFRMWQIVDAVNEKMASRADWVPVHGDARFGNLLKIDGNVTLIDWTSACVAPREYEAERLYRDLLMAHGLQFRWQLFKTTYADGHRLDFDLIEALHLLRLIEWVASTLRFNISQRELENALRAIRPAAAAAAGPVFDYTGFAARTLFARNSIRTSSEPRVRRSA